ncbi:Unknown protein sequence [Pseudomonas syringae pv. aceris]|nr:Unknown protein sequence [Pseudomonas syringae pv. aceris]
MFCTLPTHQRNQHLFKHYIQVLEFFSSRSMDSDGHIFDVGALAAKLK